MLPFCREAEEGDLGHSDVRFSSRRVWARGDAQPTVRRFSDRYPKPPIWHMLVAGRMGL
jgi:hypothetical protein